MGNNGKKVIIIEDDEHISRIYEMKLAKEGLSTVVVRDGERAITIVAQEKPDIIVLDIMIPKKDGFEVIKEIKQNPDTAGIPIIILSNLGQKSYQDRALALGATEYLVKVNYP